MKRRLPLLLKISLNLIVISFLLYLPYYLFEGRLFLGGDDTRLHYIYPLEFIKNLSFYVWANISSLPSYLPNHHSIPILFFFALLENLLNSKIQLFYFAFSLPFILGFIYFQKFIRELIDEDFGISFTSALIYIFAPITVVSQMSNFLFSMYLMALVPVIAYYYTSYIKRGENKDIVKVVIWSILLSIAFYAIQWILPIFLSLSLGLILLILIDNSIKRVFKKTIIFFYFIFSSQLFWIFPFIMSIFYKGKLTDKILSAEFVGSFSQTVLSTATGSILYPLLTFYQRRIAFDYDWQLKNVFTNYFDYAMPFSLIFIFVLFLGLIRYNQVLEERKKKIFILFFASFIAALYFSTVNISFLKDLFLLLGSIPGFAIFRNFTDKFTLAYIFTYASLISLCLYIVKKSYKFYKLVLIGVLIVVLINFIPVKQIVVSPFWKSKNVFTTINLPNEYMSFLKIASSIIPKDTNVIAFPQNIAAYAVVTEDNGKNAYIGTSPFKYLSGINDLSGSYSYPGNISDEIQKLVIKRDYESLLKLFPELNISYVMVTENIPQEVLDSYLFNKEYLKFQDDRLIESIADQEVLRSQKGNYVIYKLKNSPSILSSNIPIKYEKLSPVEYQIVISNFKGEHPLFFRETFHPGWNLNITKKNDYLLHLNKSIYKSSHRNLLPYGNKWTISSSEIINKYDKLYYKENKDGSIDVTLKLYFSPQNYFYLGVILTLLSLLSGFLYITKNEIKKENY